MKNFRTKHLKGWPRTKTAVFVFVNGLNSEIFMEWAHLLELGRDADSFRHFQYLFSAFERYPNITTFMVIA